MLNMEAVKRKIHTKNQLLRECFAECLGTFILMIFGNGSVAQVVLSKETKGTNISINWAYGLGVTLAVYVSGGVSGGHINPAISITNSIIGRLPWRKLPFYVISQFFGAFLSGAVVFGIYYDAFNDFDGGTRQVFGPNATAGIFATYPQPYLSIVGGLFDQIFGTAVLTCCVMAIGDKRNGKPTAGMEPLIVGLLVFAIGLSYGYNCGYAINPARDFGPRLFTAIAGWGSDVFFGPNGEQWWWVPILGPILGSILGAITYLLLIEFHWPDLNSTTSLQQISSINSIEKEAVELENNVSLRKKSFAHSEKF